MSDSKVLLECKQCKEGVTLLNCYDGKWLCDKCAWYDGVTGWQILMGKLRGIVSYQCEECERSVKVTAPSKRATVWMPEGPDVNDYWILCPDCFAKKDYGYTNDGAKVVCNEG